MTTLASVVGFKKGEVEKASASCTSKDSQVDTSPHTCSRAYAPTDMSQTGGGSRGGFVGFERTPLFLLIHLTYWFFDNLCYSQQCSTLSAGVPVQFGDQS